MRVGIDASGILAGGGITHLTGLLLGTNEASTPLDHMTIWGSTSTLACLPSYPWLDKVPVAALDGPLWHRYRWQSFDLASAARRACDVLLVPSGTFLGRFHPFVSISQNMLPFQLRERLRFGASRKLARLQALRFTQGYTFRHSDGVIFLSDFARNTIQRQLGPLTGLRATIPHGISDAFRRAPRAQEPISTYSRERPFRWLYVSIVDFYKHPWNVIEAAASLRRRGLPVHLELVGGGAAAPLRRLRSALARADPAGEYIRYREFVPFAQLPPLYFEADAFVFASSCENMPNILLEAMAAGLPIASSSRGPMLEVLGGTGVLFDPERPALIADAMQRIMLSAPLRHRCATDAHARAAGYSWRRCATETLDFLAEVAASFRRRASDPLGRTSLNHGCNSDGGPN